MRHWQLWQDRRNGDIVYVRRLSHMRGYWMTLRGNVASVESKWEIMAHCRLLSALSPQQHGAVWWLYERERARSG